MIKLNIICVLHCIKSFLICTNVTLLMHTLSLKVPPRETTLPRPSLPHFLPTIFYKNIARKSNLTYLIADQ